MHWGQCIITLPSTVNELDWWAFSGCIELSEVVCLGGERLLNIDRDYLSMLPMFIGHDFPDRRLCRRLSGEDGMLNKEVLKKLLGREAFYHCPSVEVKIPISWAFRERMERLPLQCRVSVLERIRRLYRLELLQDDSVLACFSLVGRDAVIKDTGHQTAWRVFQVLQLIAFLELKESSILFELTLWKSRIDETAFVPRTDCRVSVPDTVKSLIMEYCGFAGFLEPAIEGGRD